MATAPTVKRKPWHVERVQHQRTKDMRWFYNSRKWRNFSKDYKVRHPWCVDCEREGVVKASKVTDHIKTYEECPEAFDLDRLDDKYFQPQCTSHHNKKSGREAHKK
ncbi:5-methylcytosine-specific restriction protein A [Lutibacter sp. Hel_I_33_5]|uniref:HNH endonuclease n=1 Tax=Lutibacter sp. Hel_I_33_5 TaxID=1566289 RepID=UPI00119F986A|nr:HNH endonuclease [Lutibacter sp. Hel_I_33_5]TVZ55617.1 5-methylcytosine-specific restriction protein A [Lutibacter sp. Hel_I_33_5]